MKKKKIIIAVIAVVVVLVVAVGAVAAYVVKKASPYKKIVDAYNNTINADSFNVSFGLAYPGSKEYGGVGDFLNYELYGKGDSADDVIITTFPFEGEYASDNAEVVLSGSYVLHGHKVFKDNDTYYDGILEAVAQRDMTKLYKCMELDDYTGLSYDEMYSLLFDTMINYVKNNKKSDILNDVEIKGDKYSVSINPLVLFEELGKNGDFDYESFARRLFYLDGYDDTKDASWDELKKLFDSEDWQMHIELELDGKYIKNVNVEMLNWREDDNVIFCAKFENINKITSDNSIGVKILKENGIDVK